MTNSEILKEAEKLIKACVENFLLQIKKYRNNSRAKNIQKGHLDFSLFYPLNDEYSESKHFERKLAENIREYIVLDVFKGLFELHNIKVNFFNPKSVIGESLTDREERIPYEFIVYDKKCNTGYRLDYPIEQGQNWKIKIFFKLHVIKQIEILVFDKNSQIEFKNSILPETCQKYEKYISVETFFKKYFSIEEYNLYISLGRKAVQQANEEIGLRTIRTMSGYNLSNFKASLLLQYAGIQYQYMKYSFVVNKDKTNELISEDDYAILNKSFITDNLYRAFFGNEDFAKSFITSEYLFNSVGEKELFDYTSVICGYTKSVEQLIYKLLQINLLTLPSSSNLRIRSKNNSLIPFKKENEKSFNTMLNSMINFLQYNKKGWKICCYEHIIDCLSDYKDSCRNEHFHKDNIYDYDTVKRIRNNTILLFYYLLGGYKLTNSVERNHLLLGIEFDSFDRLYKKMKDIPSSVRRFVLNFGDKEIKAVRLFNQELPIYDKNGSLKDSVIYFYPVDDFNEADFDFSYSNLERDKMMVINYKNFPKKVWWYDITKNQKHLVEW